MDEAKNQINDLEHKEEKKFYQNSTKKKRIKQTKTKDKVRNLWDNFKKSNIHIIGGFQKEKRKSKYLEICLKK